METQVEPKYTMYVKVQTHKRMQMPPHFKKGNSGACVFNN